MLEGLFGKVKYVVLVSDGVTLEHCRVYETVGYNDGIVFRYKRKNGVADVVYAGKGYRALEENGTFYVGKRYGNNSAAEIDVLEGERVFVASGVIGESSDPDCPGTDLSRLIMSDFLGTGIKTCYGKMQFPWKWVIIGALVALMIFGAVRFGPRAEASERQVTDVVVSSEVQDAR